MKKVSWIFLIIISVVLFVSCQDQEYGEELIPSELIKTSLQFNIDDLQSGYDRFISASEDKSGFADKKSKSVGFDSSESYMHSIRKGIIYQFNKDGSLYYKTEPFSIELNYGVPSVVNAQLRPGRNLTVYLFVADTNESLPVLQTEKEINRLVYSYIALEESDNLPFWGVQQNISLLTNTEHSLEMFHLQRLCSKLMLNYEIDPKSGFQLREIRLSNVPDGAVYEPQSQVAGGRYESFSKYVTQNNGKFEFYIPENNQGIVSEIVEPESKNIRNAPIHATCVELIGYYKSKKVTFRIYPGANSTSDFNLKRNHWYRINLKIEDVYLDDLRIESSSMNEFVIYLTDESGRDYSNIKNILLNRELWINDFEVNGSTVTLHYTSTPGSFLHHISFCDRNGSEIFGGITGYYFSDYSSMYFSSLLEAQGNGSYAYPYSVFEPKQLKNINKLCKSGLKDRLFIQQGHLDLYYTDRNKWEPLGSAATPFQGEYDGNGYQIRNLTLNTEAAGGNHRQVPYAGLFGFVSKSVLKNIHIREGQIACKSDFMGSVAGYASYTDIEGCSSTLKIEQFQRANTGGIVGKLQNSRLTNCYNKCSREMTAWGSATYYTGGIAGFVSDSYLSDVYSVQSIWIGNYYALGAVIGGMDAGSSVSGYYASQYKTTGNKTIGAPASESGFLSDSELKSAAFVDRLNSGNGNGSKWKYQPGEYPKLYNQK